MGAERSAEHQSQLRGEELAERDPDRRKGEIEQSRHRAGVILLETHRNEPPLLAGKDIVEAQQKHDRGECSRVRAKEQSPDGREIEIGEREEQRQEDGGQHRRREQPEEVQPVHFNPACTVCTSPPLLRAPAACLIRGPRLRESRILPIDNRALGDPSRAYPPKRQR